MLQQLQVSEMLIFRYVASIGLLHPTRLQGKAILPMVMGANVLAIAPGSSSGLTIALCLGVLGRAHKIRNSVAILAPAPLAASSLARECRE